MKNQKQLAIEIQENEVESEENMQPKYLIDNRRMGKSKCKDQQLILLVRPMLVIYVLLQCGIISVIISAGIRQNAVSRSSGFFFV